MFFLKPFSIILGPILTNVKGKRIILIDDSIVRGNTVGPIIKLLRKSGAKEVHIRYLFFQFEKNLRFLQNYLPQENLIAP